MAGLRQHVSCLQKRIALHVNVNIIPEPKSCLISVQLLSAGEALLAVIWCLDVDPQWTEN